MTPVCPKCHWNPCECPARWTPPEPAFQIDEHYSAGELANRVALFARNTVWLLDPSPTPQLADIVYEFTIRPNGRCRCDAVGRRSHSNYDHLREPIALSEILQRA